MVRRYSPPPREPRPVEGARCCGFPRRSGVPSADDGCGGGRGAGDRKRWVDGVGTAVQPGEVFFEKNLPSSAPYWLSRTRLARRRVPAGRRHRRAHLAGATGRARAARPAVAGGLRRRVPPARPPRAGPGPRRGRGPGRVRRVAFLARDLLAGMGLSPLPVTSGSKGIHLYCPLDASTSSDQIAAVAHELARALESDHRDLVVSDLKKTLREGKVLVDWSQNSAAKTTIAPYSLRGRLRPAAAAPRTWEELGAEGLRHLAPDEVVERLRSDGDLLRRHLRHPGAPRAAPARRRPATASWSAGLCRRVRRWRAMRTGSRCRPRTIRLSTRPSRAPSRRASTAARRCASGMRAAMP